MANSTQQSRNIFEYNLDLHYRLWDNISSLANATRTSGHNTLSLLHHNVKSLMNKLYSYESLNLSNSIDIFFYFGNMVETWNSKLIVDLSGFNIIRCDRKSTTKTRGGGAALYINNVLKFKTIQQPQSKLRELCDSVWSNIKTQQDEGSLIVASIYLPPDADKMKFISLLSDILH